MTRALPRALPVALPCALPLVALSLGACPSDPGLQTSSAGGSSGPQTTAAASTGATAPTTGGASTGAPADQPPTAKLTADPPGGAAPVLVRLSGAASSDPEGPVTHAWALGDGAVAEGPEAEHVYAEPGAYTVTLTVTDSLGQTAQASLDLTISADCPTFASSKSPGALALPALNEASGLAASRRTPGVLWTHNDSDPDGPRVYAFAAADARFLGRWSLTGAAVVDWEDLAVGPGERPGGADLYVGDIGDNNAARPDITVYRAAEPAVDLAAPQPVDAALPGVEALVFTYPQGQAHDAETLLVDPVRGDLCVVTKRLDGLSEAYCAAAPLASGALTLAASLDVGSLATGGSVSPDGRLVAIRTYFDARVWRRDPRAPLADAFAGPSCALPLVFEMQGEALGFAADGLGYFTVSEGQDPALHAYRRQ